MVIRAAAFFALLTLLGACVPTNRAIIAQQNAKVSRARAQALVDLGELKSAHSRETKAAYERWDSLVIFPICNDGVPKGNRCGLIAEKVNDSEFRAQFAETHCSPAPEGAPQNFCTNLLVDTFFASVRARYELDPDECCRGKRCDSLVTVELAMLAAFNARIEEQSRAEAAAIDARYSARLDAIVARFGAQLQNVENETDRRLEQAGRQRAALLAVAEGLQAASDARASSPPTALPEIRSAKKCSSDYECAYGSRCVKDSGAFQGICAKSVNSFGVPTFEGPRPDSIQSGVGECSFDTECTIGFRCVKTSNGLRGNCLKAK